MATHPFPNLQMFLNWKFRLTHPFFRLMSFKVLLKGILDNFKWK